MSHGSRLRRREVSLVFNAVDSAEGLTRILNTLSAYHVRATFFVNGEFIRRYPDAVREIADSGHEVGSLFYAYFNMTDARFTVDRDFVKSGLARNEDDYNAATGQGALAPVARPVLHCELGDHLGGGGDELHVRGARPRFV